MSCGLQPTSLNHLEALLHLFSSFLRQITKGSYVYALFPAAASLSGLGTEAEFTCHSVSDISSWCQRKRGEREESAERKGEWKCGRETVVDGKMASDGYKIYDSHQNVIGLVYVSMWMTYTILPMHRPGLDGTLPSSIRLKRTIDNKAAVSTISWILVPGVWKTLDPTFPIMHLITIFHLACWYLFTGAVLKPLPPSFALLKRHTLRQPRKRSPAAPDWMNATQGAICFGISNQTNMAAGYETVILWYENSSLSWHFRLEISHAVLNPSSFGRCPSTRMHCIENEW